MDNTLHPADQRAFEKLIKCEPVWASIQTAWDAVGLPSSVLLHAGPPFANPWHITRPILNSACVAAVFEGLAKNFEDAERAIVAGRIVLKPAQEFNVVTPLAAVVSSSMKLHVIEDGSLAGNNSFAPLNGGSGPAPRLGQKSEAALEHLRWMNTELAEQLRWVQSVSLIEIAANALRKGDDCHGRTPEATKDLSTRIVPRLSGEAGQRVRVFLENGPSFFLNIWMAACKCILNSAMGIENCSLITAAGANGEHTGIQISAKPGVWFTETATPPNGKLEDGVSRERALGAIGDSAIVDALGFGAMAMNFSPVQREGLGEYMPENGLALPGQLLAGVHPGFGDLSLLIGLTARQVMSSNQQPVVSLGILDNEGELGRLGGGIFQQPISLFESALSSLDTVS